jgi:hypothetical protein
MRRLLPILALVMCTNGFAQGMLVPKWIDEARAARAELKKSHGKLFQDVSSILYKLDPVGIGVRTGGASDEYDAEAGTIIPRLKECKTAVDAQKVVFEEFVRWFGADTAGSYQSYADEGAAIWDVWVRYNTGLPSNTSLERTRGR